MLLFVATLGQKRVSTWRVQRVKHRKSDKRWLSSGCTEISLYSEMLSEMLRAYVCIHIFTSTCKYLLRKNSYALKLYILLYILLYIFFQQAYKKEQLKLIRVMHFIKVYNTYIYSCKYLSCILIKIYLMYIYY